MMRKMKPKMIKTIDELLDQLKMRNPIIIRLFNVPFLKYIGMNDDTILRLKEYEAYLETERGKRDYPLSLSVEYDQSTDDYTIKWNTWINHYDKDQMYNILLVANYYNILMPKSKILRVVSFTLNLKIDIPEHMAWSAETHSLFPPPIKNQIEAFIKSNRFSTNVELLPYELLDIINNQLIWVTY